MQINPANLAISIDKPFCNYQGMTPLCLRLKLTKYASANPQIVTAMPIATHAPASVSSKDFFPLSVLLDLLPKLGSHSGFMQQ
jgi:hypothetical protein